MKTHKAKYKEGLRIIQGRLNPKPVNSRIIYLFLFILIILLTFMYLINRNKSTRLVKNGIITKAIVEKIIHNSYIMNELDATGPNNYHITYTFKVKNDSLKGLYEILIDDYKDYFDKRLKVKDTITVIYEKQHPHNNKIIKNSN